MNEAFDVFLEKIEPTDEQKAEIQKAVDDLTVHLVQGDSPIN
jgi:hypothetical protein